MAEPIKTHWHLYLSLVAAVAASAAEAPLDETVQLRQTKDGVEFGIWGRREGQVQPTLVILAATIQETLGSGYFRQSGTRLAREGGWLCVSIDVPCHGKDQREGEKGLGGWRTRVEHGENFLPAFNARLTAVLDHLIAEGYTDAAKIAACGTSRGGYMALQFTASDPRVKAVAAFAPVTDLAALQEFTGLKDHQLVQEMAVLRQAPAFANRAVWIGIGDRDQRVSTDLAIACARALSAANARVDLHVFPEPKGHTTPAPSSEMVAAWIPAALAASPAE